MPSGAPWSDASPAPAVGDLGGLSVLVLRPRPYGEALVHAIRAYGGQAIYFPAIEISPPLNFQPLDHCLSQLHHFDLLIFVSVAAVEGWVARRQQRVPRVPLPRALKIAAIGEKTAACCRAHALPVDFVPRRATSEDLFACLQAAPLDCPRIAILRGQDGRAWLLDALKQQASAVECVPCYHRQQTRQSAQPLIAQWRRDGIDVAIITSVSIFTSLRALLGAQHADLLHATTLIAFSARIKQHCQEVGATEVLVCAAQTETALLQAIAALAARRHAHDSDHANDNHNDKPHRLG